MSVRASSAVPPSTRSSRAPEPAAAATRHRSLSPPLEKERPVNGKLVDDVKRVDPLRPVSSSKPPLSPLPVKEPDGIPAVVDEEEGSPETIDEETFNQIVELDEDDTHDFSHGMVTAYFTQARNTFDEMEQAYKDKNLDKLSSLGHFLKGSSAALGVTKVQASCERMQHYGKRWDEEAGVALTDDVAFEKIEPLLMKVKGEYGSAEKWLKNWYSERGIEEETEED
ncbi:unnamed protein product [Somion occarium]|uniref:HPt domain-containing protein n=1 Tax=Somion occarium TaxID=3059160 RepID=A0ABP1CRD0_9APHY